MASGQTAGTTFALLMSLCNLSYSLSEALGEHLYDNLGADYGYQTSFQLLVVVGAAFTALCWAVFPLLRRYAPESEGQADPSPDLQTLRLVLFNQGTALTCRGLTILRTDRSLVTSAR